MQHQALDLSQAVSYHYDKFPPGKIDLEKIMPALLAATDALARYDELLKFLRNSEILLAPLRSHEAIVSSRMEGTISTLDEVLQYEADEDGEQTGLHHRRDTIEVFMYQRALRQAQKDLEGGRPFTEHLIKATHASLMAFGRGAKTNPGQYKQEQNYIGEKGSGSVQFIPISPLHLPIGMDNLINYINNNTALPLIRIALSHLEFEALHPFGDGNGRLGRMMITLLLWKFKIIAQPHFYVSGYLEENRDEYIGRMRAVSETGDWSSWIVFFLETLAEQALRNIDTANQISTLYEEMKPQFRKLLNSQWAVHAQDFMFENPKFRNNRFTGKSGIPKPTATRISRVLSENGILKQVIPAAGRSPAMYSFEPLLEIVRKAK